MTMHAAKGLEFRTVFVLAPKPLLTKGEEATLWYSYYAQEVRLFDFYRLKSSQSARLQRLWQEEKHLLYVALTRAEDNIFLFWGNRRSGVSLMDRFLKVIVQNPTSREDLLSCLEGKVNREELLAELSECPFLELVKLTDYRGAVEQILMKEYPELLPPPAPPSREEILKRSPPPQRASLL